MLESGCLSGTAGVQAADPQTERWEELVELETDTRFLLLISCIWLLGSSENTETTNHSDPPEKLEPSESQAAPPKRLQEPSQSPLWLWVLV